MKIFISILRLIRFPNLVLIAMTQFLIWYCIITPIFNSYGVPRFLDDLHFLLLALSTLLIAASGYIINDYNDVGIDTINKPHRLIIGSVINKNFIMPVYFTCNIIAIGIGIYLGWYVGNYKLGYLHFFTASLLWFYATSFKKMLLVGNLIVSFLSAFVLLIVVFYEPMLYLAEAPSTVAASGAILLIIGSYAVFAFFVSLVREIVKDMEDIKGDADYDCRTLPIVFGILPGKAIVAFLVISILCGIGWIQKIQFVGHQFYEFWYLMLALQLPLIVFLAGLYKAEHKKHYHRLSLLIKIVMFLGVLSMLYFFILIFE